RLHDDLARTAVNGEIREHQLLNAVEVPGIAGDHLVIPLQVAGIDIHCHNRANVQIVFALRLAKLLRPRTSIAGTGVYEIGFRIIGNAIPNCAATAEFPPLARPGFGGLLHCWTFETFRGITRNRVEPPGELSVVGVVGRKETADRILRATHTDNDFALRNPRRHRNGVVVLRIFDARFPSRFSGFTVESDKASVDYRSDYLVLIDREPTIYNSAAYLGLNRLAIHFRIPTPLLFTRACVNGENNAPVRDAI